MNKFFFFLFIFTSSYSQKIKGTITDSIGVVYNANIFIKDKNEVIKNYTKSNIEGKYELLFTKDNDSLFVEITTLYHNPKILEINKLKFNNNELILNVYLEERSIALKEVILKKSNPIIQKKDTTIYNPEFFRDGSERVVEDLLKKLPGIKIEENGIIKFKGKEIKKLLLDGDDLFSSNYILGSKNINVDLIDKVQGIEHYEENSLLKGIRDSDDVALNLILKKGKTDLTGNANLGYGYESNIDNNISAVLVNSKIKGFGVASYNNVGQNKTPYNAKSDFQSFDRNEEKHSKTLINQGYFNSVLDSKFHSLNNYFFVSGNSLFKIKEKSSLKLNAGFYDDRISRQNQNNSNYVIGNESFTINENNSLIKKPVLYDATANYSNKEKASFHWDYLGKFNYSKTSFIDNSNNNDLIQSNQVDSEALFIKQNINSTYKISNKTVILNSFDFSKSNAPQQLNINPGTLVDSENSLISAIQDSRFDDQLLRVKSSLYSKKDNLKLVIDAEYLSTKSKLFSLLKNEDGNSLGDFYKNDNAFSVNLFSIKPVLVYNRKKYAFKFGVNTFYTSTTLEDYVNSKLSSENEIVLAPLLMFNIKLNRKSSFLSSYSYNAVLPEVDQLFSGIVQTNYRSFSNNELSQEFLKTHSYNIGYSYNDFYNLKQFSININHDFRPNNYFSNTLINQNITINNSFLSSLSTKDYNLNISGETYFHPLKTTLRLNGSYSLSYDKNVVNNSDIRDIKGNTLFLNVIARVGFRSKISFENNIFYLYNSYEVENIKTKFQSLTNQTKIIYKLTKEIKIYSIANIISPDLNQNTNYLFLESEINYSPLNKKYGLSLIAKNITNNKTFETRSISDFSSSTISHNLIERYVMLKLYFSF